MKTLLSLVELGREPGKNPHRRNTLIPDPTCMGRLRRLIRYCSGCPIRACKRTFEVIDGLEASGKDADNRSVFLIREKMPIPSNHFVGLVSDPGVDHALVDTFSGTV